MNKIITIILIFIMNTYANAETLKTPSFWLQYSDAWKEIKSNSKNNYKLISNKYRTYVTLSFNQLSQKSVKEAANEYLTIRYNAENEITKERKRKNNIEKSIKKLPFGYQIEYFGNDSSGRQFRYWAVVTETKIVNLYIESYDQTKEGIERIFRDLLKGLKL